MTGIRGKANKRSVLLYQRSIFAEHASSQPSGIPRSLIPFGPKEKSDNNCARMPHGRHITRPRYRYRNAASPLLPRAKTGCIRGLPRRSPRSATPVAPVVGARGRSVYPIEPDFEISKIDHALETETFFWYRPHGSGTRRVRVSTFAGGRCKTFVPSDVGLDDRTYGKRVSRREPPAGGHAGSVMPNEFSWVAPRVKVLMGGRLRELGVSRCDLGLAW